LRGQQDIGAGMLQKRLYPEIETSTVIAWQRNIPYSPATSRFIEEINAYARSQNWH